MQNGSEGGDKGKPVNRLRSLKHITARKQPATSSKSAGDAATNPTPVKKSFVPNLNVTRAAPTEAEVKSDANDEQSRGKKDRFKNWKERPKKEFIQTAGVFSDGVASQQMGGTGRPGFTTSASTDGSSASNVMLAECIENETLDDIMTGNFLSDVKNENCPLSLVGDASNLSKRVLSSGRQSSPSSAEDQLYMFQLPSFLPFCFPREQPDDQVDREDDSKDVDGGESEVQKGMSIKDLPEGMIGSFEILDNGDMRMVFGGGENNDKVLMNCRPASENHQLTLSLFCQDQVAQTIQFCGNIENQLICTPCFTGLVDEQISSSSDDDKQTVETEIRS